MHALSVRRRARACSWMLLRRSPLRQQTRGLTSTRASVRGRGRYRRLSSPVGDRHCPPPGMLTVSAHSRGRASLNAQVPVFHVLKLRRPVPAAKWRLKSSGRIASRDQEAGALRVYVKDDAQPLSAARRPPDDTYQVTFHASHRNSRRSGGMISLCAWKRLALYALAAIRQPAALRRRGGEGAHPVQASGCSLALDGTPRLRW